MPLMIVHAEDGRLTRAAKHVLWFCAAEWLVSSIVVAGIYSLKYSLPEAMVKGVWSGFIIAAGSYVPFYMAYKLLNFGKEYDGPRVKRTVLIQKSEVGVLKLCEEALKNLGKKYTVQESAADPNIITAITRPTWKSFGGEIVTFRLFNNPNGIVGVTISSKPALATTTQDWGTNRRNLEKILKSIEASLLPSEFINCD